MNKTKFRQFVEFLLKNNLVIVPQYNVEGYLHLAELKNPKDLYLGTELPLDSWKWYLIPPFQKMFDYKNDQFKEILPKVGKQIFLGVSILDLQALTLLNQVFEQDPYYQEIKKKTIVIGTSHVPKENFYKYFAKFEEDKLEHLQFDIFLAVQKNGYKIYSGSEDGQRLLDKFKYKNYQHIEYAGPIREEGLDQQMVSVMDGMQNFHEQKIWDDLGKRCMQCGKCTIACPVCFCFRMYDQSNLEKDSGYRSRCWDTCFYNEFTQVAGPAPAAPKHRLMNTTSQKIYFWYEHHFVRTPASFSLPGCVGCGRCTRTCPADIDIFQTQRDILKARQRKK
ncbi:MAG: 4Fe-4S dicluster domain-containing protein [Candidatus Parcubacteria bacterium]|nr:4Fe-4S dicluster domain-containing protein [Candidatus Parcubacteria bacterium]